MTQGILTRGLRTTFAKSGSPITCTSRRFGSVAVEGELYVRAYGGKRSRWYQAAMRQKAGRINAAGMICDVRFEPVDGPINDRVDDAYRAKYCGSPYLDAMLSGNARPATLRITPRNKG